MALILFIDDDLGARVLYEKACAILGHQSLVADSGLHGLALAKTHQPNLILLDLSLPDMDGLNVMIRLRQDELTSHIPVVIVSAGKSQTDAQQLTAAGANDYLSKPVGLNALQQTIDQFADHQCQSTVSG